MRRLGVVLALASIATACAPSPPTLRNVILISVDTLRADHLGAYGHPRPTSPNLDAFAAAGVVFEDVSSTSPWTLPAHTSLFTGRYLRGHGVHTEGHRLPDDVPTLAAILKERGFATGAVVNTLFLSPRFGVARGFDHYGVIESDQSPEGAARRVTDAAIAWLEDRSEPFFLFVHHFDVHSDYRSLPQHERRFAPEPGRFDGRTIQLLLAIRGDKPIDAADALHLAKLYDAGIFQLDAELARFFAWLRERGRLEDTLVIVTSDHGEEFLEHGGLLHGSTHYQELLRVPLLLGGAGVPAGVRIAAPVSTVDVAPTVLSLLGVPAPPGVDGIDLSPLWRGEDADPGRALMAEAASPVLRTVRRGRHKLIIRAENGDRELYDLSEDPGESRDLASTQTELADSLAAEAVGLARAAREPEPAAELTPEQKAHLRSLGYLGVGEDEPAADSGAGPP
jgi:arylsulfatase A-like enzyme